MLTGLNIALVVIATASTIAAFGGETWEKGDAPILKRITPRGWASLSFLLLAFALGITKEVFTKNAGKLDKADEKQRQTELTGQLKLAQTELLSQRELMLSEKERLKSLTDDLAQAKSRVIDVQSYLASTRANLVQQSTVNLITALSDSKNKIAEVWVMLPILETGPKDLDAQNLVVSGFNQNKCANGEVDTGGTLELGGLNYYYLHPRVRGEFKNSVPPGVVIDGNQGSPADYFKLVNQLARQNSANRYVLTFRVRPDTTPVPKGASYTFNPNPIAADFVLNMMTTSTPLSFGIALNGCITVPRNLISRTFDKAVLILVLEGSQGRALYYRLRAQPIRASKHGLTMGFRADSLPTFAGFPVQEITIGPSDIMDHPERYKR